ncbi:helix-turn-helix transcriptional regulator [Blautia liquoris]|jgi:transcriptional regulator with XRE-family HTH domain|uniref:Helix-turn-helix transcriptional regulator n=1 Tax=Blautia liquoris TaxID=2779518 RepID=A0A7M2RF17_9FIRM|nr:helix-turn-helix transcriptional regulator [Blautia liquoris]QOV18943.1 helix-turn-helix transcriptional regulator [Blautia liquoris]
MGLYEQIRDIAKEKGYSINRLEKELGFARSSINKFNKNMPSADKVQQIADFLHVSVDYLMTGKKESENNETRLNAKDEKDIAKRLQDTLEDLENGQTALAFSGEPLDDETRELLKISLENSLRIAKINAKKKFTPKKYRK